MQTMETSHREMVAEFKPETKDTRKEMIACWETTEAHLEEERTMACQEMEARPEDGRADLSGHETWGGRTTRGTRSRRHSDAGRRTEEETA
jgi:hypothetical protein